MAGKKSLIGSEARFREDFIELMRSDGHFVSHIESPITSPGIPDLFVKTNNTQDLWIELKVLKSNGVCIRPTQVKWHDGHMFCGGTSFIMVSAGREILILPWAAARMSWQHPSEFVRKCYDSSGGGTVVYSDDPRWARHAVSAMEDMV